MAHREHVDPGTDPAEERHDVVDVVVETEGSLGQRNVAGVVPIGDVHVVVLREGAHGRPEQGGEVPGERGHDKHFGLDDLGVLGEVQERGERRRHHHLLAHAHRLALDLHGVDAEGGSMMGEPGPRHQLVGGRDPADDRVLTNRSREAIEGAGDEFGQSLHRCRSIDLGLVRPVQHPPS